MSNCVCSSGLGLPASAVAQHGVARGDHLAHDRDKDDLRPALSQQPARLPRLAIVNPISQTYPSFFEELARLGYEEGRNLIVERWSAEGKAERFREIAQQVARSKPDVVLAVSARLVQELKLATADIRVPVVTFTLDPVG